MHHVKVYQETHLEKMNKQKYICTWTQFSHRRC